MNNSLLFSVLIWTFVFYLAIFRAKQQKGVIHGILYKLHIVIAWMLLIIHIESVKQIAFLIQHHEVVIKEFYVPLGSFSPILSISFWLGKVLFGLISVILSFALVYRNEKGRKVFLYLFVLIFLFDSTAGLRFFYKTNSGNSTNYLALSILALSASLPALIAYVFYRTKKVRDRIFKVDDSII